MTKGKRLKVVRFLISPNKKKVKGNDDERERPQTTLAHMIIKVIEARYNFFKEKSSSPLVFKLESKIRKLILERERT